jgi:hypothetical protein
MAGDRYEKFRGTPLGLSLVSMAENGSRYTEYAALSRAGVPAVAALNDEIMRTHPEIATDDFAKQALGSFVGNVMRRYGHKILRRSRVPGTVFTYGALWTGFPVDDPEVEHLIVYCDESGAKGYANRDESFPGEVGVFAGLFAPGSVIPRLQAEFDTAVQSYIAADGKLHITDLDPTRQKELRTKLFELVRKNRLPCFWEAIHVAGFHKVHNAQNAFVDAVRNSQRSSVKISSNAPAPASLHVALFQGFYSKILAFCIERRRHRLHLEIRTDRVDAPIIKQFQEAAESLMNFGVTVKRVTGYDPKTKTVVEAHIGIREIPDAERLPIIVEQLDIRIAGEHDGLAVTADVLANSINHILVSRSSNELFSSLNSPDAMKEHPLEQYLDAFESWSSYNFTDTVYAHPRDPGKLRE